MIDLIGRAKLLEGLNEEQVSKFAEMCEERGFTTGEIIVRAGDSVRNLYLLIEGVCSVEIDVGEHLRHLAVDSLKEGDAFGEMGFLNGKPRAATVVCKESCKVLIMNEQNFEKLVEEKPDITTVVIKNIALILADKIRATHPAFKEAYLRGLTTI